MTDKERLELAIEDIKRLATLAINLEKLLFGSILKKLQ